MIFWRVWFVHNEVTHYKPLPSVKGSKRFLISYLNSLILLKQHPNTDPAKGKEVVIPEQAVPRSRKKEGEQRKKKSKWTAPNQGQAKLNVDGSYAQDGSAGTGMVLRDSMGTVIFPACRQLFHCADALEAELAALEEGINLALHWTRRYTSWSRRIARKPVN